jgi:TrkA domain protein
MPTRETELPGVGRKFTLELASGGDLVVVEHRAGRFELSRLDEEGNSDTLVRLEPQEAADLGRILARGQHTIEDERRQMLFEQAAIEWVTLEADSPLVGETLQGSALRARTGVSVIAILRRDGSLPAPPPQTQIMAGDTLVVIGRPEQVARFAETAAVRTATAE